MTHKDITRLRKCEKVCNTLHGLSDAIDNVADLDKKVKEQLNAKIRSEHYLDIERLSKIIFDYANTVKFQGRVFYQKNDNSNQ
jgi:hypothetical protein